MRRCNVALPAAADDTVEIAAAEWQQAVVVGLAASAAEIEDATDTLDVLYEICPVEVRDVVLVFVERQGYPVG